MSFSDNFALQGDHHVEALFGADRGETIEVGGIDDPNPAHFDEAAGELGRRSGEFTTVRANSHEVVGDHPAYLTFDIDCLDPAFAPGTGTPVIGGLTTSTFLTLLCVPVLYSLLTRGSRETPAAVTQGWSGRSELGESSD